MSLSLIVGPLTREEVDRAVAALAQAGINVFSGSAVAVPMTAPPTAPVVSAAPAVPAPPAVPPVAAAAANPKLEQALALMGTYSQTHGVPVARQVLAMCQLQRVQDANDQQLDWLIGAFGNVAWKP